MTCTYTKFKGAQKCKELGGSLPTIKTQKDIGAFHKLAKGEKLIPVGFFRNRETARYLYPNGEDMENYWETVSVQNDEQYETKQFQSTKWNKIPVSWSSGHGGHATMDYAPFFFIDKW